MDLQRADIDKWCLRWLDIPVHRVLFHTGHRAAVVGVELADRSRVVIKARPDKSWLTGCIQVQALVAATAYPAPRIHVPPQQLGQLLATAEELLPTTTTHAAGEDRRGDAQTHRVLDLDAAAAGDGEDQDGQRLDQEHCDHEERDHEDGHDLRDPMLAARNDNPHRDPDGQHTDPLGHTRRSAQALAALMARTPHHRDIESIDPPPPWSVPGWPPGFGGWPSWDDRRTLLSTDPRPRWVVVMSRRLQARMADMDTSNRVIGHTDWSPQHVRYRNGRLAAVYGWDNLAALPEAVIAGLAAIRHARPGPELDLRTAEATEPGSGSVGIGRTAAFLLAYRDARGHPFTTRELQSAWAAALWSRTFHALTATLSPDQRSQALQQLHHDADRWLEQAGA